MERSVDFISFISFRLTWNDGYVWWGWWRTELRNQDRTIWFIRARRNTDRLHEIHEITIAALGSSGVNASHRPENISNSTCTHKSTTLIDVRLSPHKRRRSGHFLTAASCQNVWPGRAVHTRWTSKIDERESCINVSGL